MKTVDDIIIDDLTNEIMEGAIKDLTKLAKPGSNNHMMLNDETLNIIIKNIVRVLYDQS